MGAKIIESTPAAKELFDKASEILGYDLADVCKNGPAEKLDSTVVSQPALFVTSLAALEMLKDESPEIVASCDIAAGLSLGEYTALTFAGAMTFRRRSARCQTPWRSNAGRCRCNTFGHGQPAVVIN